MRWLFHDPKDAHEAAERRDVLRRIDAWWAEFARNADALCATFKHQAHLDVPRWMHDTLQAVDGRLCWEYGPALRGDGHRLVITPEADRHLRPMVDTLLERAPRIAGWEFHPYRPPESVELARLTVEARVKLTIPDARVSVARGRGNLIDVVFRSPAFRTATQEQADHAAFVATETLLGEAALDKWVGFVGAERTDEKSREAPATDRRFLPLERLKPTFDSVVAATLEQLPDRPLHELDLTGGSHPWSSYQVEAPQQPEYPERDDVFVGNTARVEVMQATGSPSFFSGRFSRFGETFCYLKIDREGIPKGQWVEFRSRFEDALEPALRAAGVGCIHGAATGIAYSYIDLALTDVGRAIGILRRTLLPLDVPTRSWLLFFDREYGDEWVGLREQTPAPPRRDEAAEEE